MSLTLKDLKAHRPNEWGCDPSWEPATLADLVEVLKQEGAEVTEARQEAPGWRAQIRLPRSAIDGDLWLVLPLEDTP